MLKAVISTGTQNADVKKHYTDSQLDVVVDSARLFDRFAVIGQFRSSSVNQSQMRLDTTITSV